MSRSARSFSARSRLPNNAFKQTAGTEAVADILFFRKREEKIPDLSAEEAWLGYGQDGRGVRDKPITFSRIPQMILGTLAEEHGLYGGIDTTVKPDGRALQDALAEAIQELATRASIKIAPQHRRPKMQTGVGGRLQRQSRFCYKAEGGRLYMRVGDEMVEQAHPQKPEGRISADTGHDRASARSCTISSIFRSRAVRTKC